VLKRLEDALASGDTIHAIIKSIALNNDGATKVSYTAPGVQAQAEVIAMALGLANVAPEGIAYVEAHGTGTDLGDPIEVTALTQAFQRKQELPPNSIALGSVKTNIGHADAAAGIAGLIKTVMALKHRLIPPNLHFETPNPKIDFANTPFFVNKELSGWPDKLGPRRAGVSSFGIGGTNAHAVLEEAPILEPVSRSRPWQLLLLSAKTESALNTATENLVFYLRQHPEVNLADVAYTYQVGRQPFFHRRMLVCQQEIEVSDILQSSTSAGAYALVQESALNRVAFMFSGQGAQYIGMAAELYETEAIFKEWVDYCADYLRPYLGQDLRQWLYPQPGDEDEATQRLQETAVAQPALFVFEYALAKLWMHWGVAPEAMIGHSIGEYVAACLAGVFSLEDALQIVTVRGRLMQALPGGSMVAVSLPAEEVMPFLGEKLSLAAINAPEVCVVSGSHDAINAWYEQMITAGVACQLLHTSHAFHSTMMEPILATFTKEMQRMQLHPPQLPYVSNVTGDWITEADATDPAYWAKHLRQTVHFSAGLDRLVANNDFVLLEVGPGNALTRLARQSPSFTSGTVTLPSVRHPQQEQSDVAFLLNTLGQLWLAGLTIDWDSFYSHERRWRLPLPTYPFERQRYWIDPQGQSSWQFAMGSQQKRKALSNWFYTLSWLQKPLSDNGLALEPSKRWLIFVDDEGVAKRLQTRLVTAGHKVIIAQKGTEFGWNDRFYTLHPTNAHNYEALLDDLEKRRMLPDVILHMWEMTTVAEVDTKHEMNGFYSLLYLAQALAHQGDSMPRSLIVVTTGMYDVTGDEALQPQKATMLGPLKIIPQEMPYLTCRHVDFVLPQTERAAARLQEQLWQEFVWAREMVEETAVAYRGHHRWIQTVQALSLPPEPAPNRLRRQGVYLITGGLGGIGLALAAYLAETVQARLVLVNRSNFPEEMDWARLATQPHTPPKLREQINQLQALKSHGAEIWVARADVTEQDQVQAILAQVRQKFGAIHGVIHAAGVAGGGLLHLKTENEANRVLAPKVTGTRILYDALRGDALDFFVCCSSLTAVTGAVGQVDYCAANAFQDAFARAQRATNGAQIISINWPTWHETGMAAATLSNLPPVMARLRKQALAEGIATSEGVTAFAQMLPAILPQIIVSPQPLADVMNQVNSLTLPQLLQELQSDTVGNGYTRPALETAYEAPRNEIEEQVAGIYQSLLGIEGVGIYDSFFELGGHSLLATQLVAQIQEFHEVALPLQVLFNSPTVVGIVEFIETTRWAVGRGETDATPETEYEEFTV
jgi:acyl transferase domain-containing protein/acyl carrier protein